MRRLLRSLWAQVLAAAVLGAAVGFFRPALGSALQPVGDGFVRLVRMVIAPIIFTTVVTAIAKVGGRRKLGRVAWKAIVTFEILTTLALLLGVVAGKVLAPGAGMNVDATHIDARAIAGYTTAGKALTASEFLLGIIPKDVVDAFAKDDVLQVIFFSVLFGVALALLRDAATAVAAFVEDLSGLLFRIMAIVMRVAPLGAFGAMAYTTGKFGLGTLAALGKLIAAFYLACALFVLVVLGVALRWTGLGLFRFLRYLRQEILITLGTSSSESALPLLMEKLGRLGCSRPVVGFATPLGYSFNLTGTAIYLTIATAFIAQATSTPLSAGKGLEIFAVLMVTSKTAAAVTGGGFIALAATLTAVGSVPVAGLTLLVGIDRIMSEARALTNLIGNGVAAVAVSRWEGELDLERARAVLSSVATVEAEEYDAGHIDPKAAVPVVLH
ncbi:MAG TPA: C4-dicarboxylate transporter DctA [Anaeromyxobacteraceae bacterium]